MQELEELRKQKKEVFKRKWQILGEEMKINQKLRENITELYKQRPLPKEEIAEVEEIIDGL